MRGVGQLDLFGHLFAIVAQPPYAPCGVVAINVHATLGRESSAAVNIAAGDGARLGVRVLDYWSNDGRRAGRVVRVDRLAALHDAPAVVAAALDAEDHLPQVPADITHPQVTGLGVKTHPPWIAEAVRPDFRPGTERGGKRVVRWHTIGKAGVTAVDVDAQDRCQQIADVLTGFQAVRWVRRLGVAGGNVEHPVRTEVERAAVVSASEPFEQHLTRGEIDHSWGGRLGQSITYKVRAVLLLRPQSVADKQLAVLDELGMKREAKRLGQPRKLNLDVQHEVGLCHRFIRWKGEELAIELQYKKPVECTVEPDLHRLPKLEVGKGGNRDQRRHRDRRGRHPRAIPSQALGCCALGQGQQYGHEQCQNNASGKHASAEVWPSSPAWPSGK